MNFISIRPIFTISCLIFTRFDNSRFLVFCRFFVFFVQKKLRFWTSVWEISNGNIPEISATRAPKHFYLWWSKIVNWQQFVEISTLPKLASNLDRGNNDQNSLLTFLMCLLKVKWVAIFFFKIRCPRSLFLLKIDCQKRHFSTNFSCGTILTNVKIFFDAVVFLLGIQKQYVFLLCFTRILSPATHFWIGILSNYFSLDIPFFSLQAWVDIRLFEKYGFESKSFKICRLDHRNNLSGEVFRKKILKMDHLRNFLSQK